jgi:hypothetical protein
MGAAGRGGIAYIGQQQFVGWDFLCLNHGVDTKESVDIASINFCFAAFYQETVR